jgi:hypothetical protein
MPMSTIRTHNVEAGLPTLDEARRMVAAEIKRAKPAGAKVLKVIHGSRRRHFSNSRESGFSYFWQGTDD